MVPFSATLGGIPIKIVRDGAKLDDVPFAQVLAKGTRSGVPRVLSVDMNEPRVLSCMAHVFGTTKDNLIDNIAAINRGIFAGCDLVMQSTDATRSVTFRVLPSQLSVPGLLDIRFETGLRTSLPLSLSLEPYAYGPETIVYSGSVGLPNLIDIDVPGDYRTPLSISLNPVSDAVHALYMGLLPNQTTPLLSLLKPASYAPYDHIGTIGVGSPAPVNLLWHGLTTGQTVEFWGGNTAPATNGIPYVVTVVDVSNFTIPVAVTVASAANVTRFTTPNTGVQVGNYANTGAYSGHALGYGGSTWACWEIDDRLLPPGTYLPLVRAAQSGAGTNNLRFGDSFVTDREVVLADTGAAMSLEAMPRTVHLPYFKMAPPAATWHAPSLWWLNGGGTPTLDYLALMPTTWGWASYHQDVASTGSYMITLGWDGTVYDTNSAAPSGRSGGMSAVGEQSLFMVPGARHSAPYFAGITGSLVITVIPRYALWR